MRTINKDLILQIFKAAYHRQSFIDNVLLPTVQGKVDKLDVKDLKDIIHVNGQRLNDKLTADVKA